MKGPQPHTGRPETPQAPTTRTLRGLTLSNGGQQPDAPPQREDRDPSAPDSAQGPHDQTHKLTGRHKAVTKAGDRQESQACTRGVGRGKSVSTES